MGVVQRLISMFYGENYKKDNATQTYGQNDPDNWFPSGKPIKPVAPEGIDIRQFEHPVNINLNPQPKQNEGVSFKMLRQLADGYDLLRLAIETRKDQLEILDFEIKVKDAKGSDSENADTKAIKALLGFPDGVHAWSRWLRMLLEDLFVLDAPCIEVQRDRSGKVIALLPVDGGTIKQVLGDDGRLSKEFPQYQQILYGLPAIDLGFDDVVYYPRNCRTNKIYGYSPVEQIIMTVRIALNRQTSQGDYYTEGNVPTMLIQVPDNWTPLQINEFQLYWDTLCNKNNNFNKRKVKFIPGQTTPMSIQESPLKDQYDEWLARIICYAFSLPPTSLTREVNRSVAEVQQTTGMDEGMLPLMRYVAEVINMVINRYMNHPEIEFVWKTDQRKQLPDAQVDQIYLANNVYSTEFVRKRDGIIDDNIAAEDEARKQTALDIQNKSAQPKPPIEGETPPVEPVTKGDIVEKKKTTRTKHWLNY